MLEEMETVWREKREKLSELPSDKEIWKQVMAALPRTEKEKEGCLTEMQRMYDLRKLYEKELKLKYQNNETIR